MVGWSMSESLDRRVCVAALDMAVRARKPPKGLMHHSDRGSQCASRAYTDRLPKAGIVASMSRVGDCWDNAVAESFFSMLKTELISQRRFATTAEARTAVFDDIKVFYNSARAHGHGSYNSPFPHENQAMNGLTK